MSRPVALADAPTGAPTVDGAVSLARAGRITEALGALTDLLADLHTDTALGEHRVRVTAAALECRLARGDLSQAMALGDLLGDPSGRQDPEPAAVASHARGELAAAVGDPDTALGHFLAAGELLTEVPPRPDHVAELPWRAGAAFVLVRQGRVPEAVALARDQLDAARAAGSPYALALALRTLAAAEPGSTRVAVLREARAALDGVRADRLAAQIDTDLAGLLLLTPAPGAAAEALALLRAVEGYAGREELWPLQGRVRRLLDLLGEAPRRMPSEALATLTASESRVAGLAADGLTNRQIAERLTVTVKAVEWHLSHVYRKLGIPSRTRLAGALGGAG